MQSMGICMTSREFNCLLCGRKFRRVTADCIMLEFTICDACYAELLILEEPALTRRVTELLQGKPHLGEEVAKAVVQVIQTKKART
jgi:hypothetical protein